MVSRPARVLMSRSTSTSISMLVPPFFGIGLSVPLEKKMRMCRREKRGIRERWKPAWDLVEGKGGVLRTREGRGGVG